MGRLGAIACGRWHNIDLTVVAIAAFCQHSGRNGVRLALWLVADESDGVDYVANEHSNRNDAVL